MANEILDKYGTSTAFTITLNALAHSVVGVGRQSTLVDFSAVTEQWLEIYIKLTQGTNPTSNRACWLYWLKSDEHGTPHITDGAGASDAAITILNAPLLGSWTNDATAVDDEIIYGEALVRTPGGKAGVAVVHDTGVNLKATDADHWVRYRPVTPEIQ
ncbi:MAG TPA: hypothetical protein VM223_27030 [Planctomycetota bacterium]|nr:hypothetical protein [Planctomycetota bacterium]